MDRSTGLELLPAAYATARRLNDEGAGHARIARVLDVLGGGRPPAAGDRRVEAGRDLGS